MMVKPIAGPFKGETHPPRYRLHKYWARKPHNVVKAHIAHYTLPGDIVLDPFCGSGVTIAESLLAGRKAVGIDLNPLAVEVTRALINSCSMEELAEAFRIIEDKVAGYIEQKFSHPCPLCNKKVTIKHRVCSSVATCPNCLNEQILGTPEEKSVKKINCNSCGERILSEFVTRDLINAVVLDCKKCRYKGRLFVANGSLGFAKGGAKFFPNRRIMAYPGMHCGSLFTSENWKYLKKLKAAILELDEALQPSFLTLLSSTASQVSRLIPYRQNLSSGGPAWTVPGFWVPRVHIQLNVWRTFFNRYKNFMRAMTDMRGPGMRPSSLTDSFEDLHYSPPGFGLVYEGDSCQLSLPDESVDYIITDPPYGDSIPYLEFSQIWNEWIGRKPLYEKEVVISNSPERCKGMENYGSGLSKVFSEMGRVLKPGKWATVFFQNRNLSVWNLLRLAARKAGLVLKSVSLQYPAVVSGKSQLAREGSLTGDLVLQFQKEIYLNKKVSSDLSSSLAKAGEKQNTTVVIESIIDSSVARHSGKKNSFSLIASDVLVELWEKNCDFKCGDIGTRIRSRIVGGSFINEKTNSNEETDNL
jgi:SAM-dependent methyltransferase